MDKEATLIWILKKNCNLPKFFNFIVKKSVKMKANFVTLRPSASDDLFYSNILDGIEVIKRWFYKKIKNLHCCFVIKNKIIII